MSWWGSHEVKFCFFAAMLPFRYSVQRCPIQGRFDGPQSPYPMLCLPSSTIHADVGSSSHWQARKAQRVVLRLKSCQILASSVLIHNGFCRLQPYSASTKWWYCCGLRRQRFRKMRHPTIGWEQLGSHDRSTQIWPQILQQISMYP